MKSIKVNIYYILGLLMLLPQLAFSQSIRLLEAYPSEGKLTIHAKLDLAEKNIRRVIGYTYRMTDGFFEQSSTYVLIDNQYVTADLVAYSGDYAYQLEVILDDNTRLVTECVNRNGGDPFMWLGDLKWSSAISGHPTYKTRVDSCANPNLPMKMKGTRFYKGISNHAQGTIMYDLPAAMNFNRFVTRMMFQDETGGSGKVGVKLNDGNEDFYTRSSGGEIINYSKNLTVGGPSKLYLNSHSNGDITGDITNFALARLYFTNTSNSKLPQTIAFTTQPEQVNYAKEINLEATATSGETVHYRIVSGHDLVSLNGSTLRFLENKTGEVTVEAMQYGNDQYNFVSNRISFSVNTGFICELLSVRDMASGKEKLAYLHLRTYDRTLTSLKLLLFNHVLNLDQIGEIDLTEYLTREGSFISNVLAVPIPHDANVCRLQYAFSDAQESKYSGYYENGLSFDYMSDLPYQVQSGHGSAQVDKSFSGGVLQITNQTYKKGFGIHAGGNRGYVSVSILPDKYERFVAEVGKQNGQPYKILFRLLFNGAEVANTGAIDKSQKISWDKVLGSANMVRINVDEGGDGNGNDHAAIGGARFYMKQTPKQDQSLSWQDEMVLNQNKPFRMNLEAKASSGLDITYRIVEGAEYASIEQQELVLNTIPERATIVVEAFQPGNAQWNPSEIKTCRFYLTKSIVVQKNERIELQKGEDLEELIVYADSASIGQVVVKEGLVKIKKLILRYTFIPKQWNFISFPSDLNIDKISNLNELGYTLNGRGSSQGAYYIRKYNTQLRAEQPNIDAWEKLNEPTVKGLQGYILGINNGLGMAPREVSFEINNVSLDFESTVRILNLTLDMTNATINEAQNVYITPVNVKGNTLKVAVKYTPESKAGLPINYKEALREARITYVPNRKGIRLTLPDPTPAKVAIYDRKLRKLKKAVNYVSPMMIDISDLKSGEYKMVVSYGNAIELKSFEK